MRNWPKHAEQRVQRAMGATGVTERRWAAHVARELIVTARDPGENDLSVYRRLIEQTVDRVAVLSDRVEQERIELEELVQVIEGQLEQESQLARERIAAAEAVLKTEEATRRLERKARNAETRARRAIEEGRADGVISRHVLVDPGAWQTLVREARRQRTMVMTLAGRALAAEAAALEAGDVTGLPSMRQRRSPGERDARPTDRVARLRLALEAWQVIAHAAASAETSAGRYAGEVVEATAHALGWRSQ